jgi:hypothetical protein
MKLDEFVKRVIEDRLTGEELVGFLDVDIEDVLLVALEEEWINEDNIEELLNYVGIEPYEE